ncbi:MAG: lipase family protein [Aeromicrobium sp.]
MKFTSTRPTHDRRRPILRGTAVLVTVVACGTVSVTVAGSTATGAEKAASAITVPSFYDPPADLPSANGAIVRSEPLKLGLRLPGLNGPLPGTATRLMFKSTDANGKPVAVTGAYIEPTAQWKGPGPRPLVVQASGTMGQGDQCAPSLALENPLALNLTEGTVSVGYENIATYRLLSKGIAVMSSDYVGLGATDRLHTYAGRLDQGHAILDAARAARALPGTSLKATSRVGLYGYSQGGGAVASAAELLPSYAPDLQVSGAYVGAPPADLTRVIDGIDGSALAVALAWTVNGMMQTVPSLKPVLDSYLNDKGRAVLAGATTQCVGDGLLTYAFTKSTSLTKQGISMSEILRREPAIKHVVDAQRIGLTKPATPVRIATGISDDTVPHAQVRQLAVDWCRAGANVTYKPILIADLGQKVVLTNHFIPLITDQGDALAWITDRVAGKGATSNCRVLPLLP